MTEYTAMITGEDNRISGYMVRTDERLEFPIVSDAPIIQLLKHNNICNGFGGYIDPDNIICLKIDDLYLLVLYEPGFKDAIESALRMNFADFIMGTYKNIADSKVLWRKPVPIDTNYYYLESLMDMSTLPLRDKEGTVYSLKDNDGYVIRTSDILDEFLDRWPDDEFGVKDKVSVEEILKVIENDVLEEPVEERMG